MDSNVYVFNRQQLLQALEAHAANQSPAMAAHTRNTVLALLDGPAAAEAGMHFSASKNPSPTRSSSTGVTP